MGTLLEGGSFETWNDPKGNPLLALNRDGSVIGQSLGFMDGSRVTVKTATVNISSTQIKAANTTPALVMAGISGHYYYLIQVALEYKFVSIPYIDPSSANINVQLGSPVAADLPLNSEAATGFLDLTQSAIAVLTRIEDGSQPIFSAAVSGQGIYVAFSSAVTTGNGLLNVSAVYQDFVL